MSGANRPERYRPGEGYEANGDAPPPKAGDCVFCGRQIGRESYCYGCQAFICFQCVPKDTGPFGYTHDVDDHMLDQIEDIAGGANPGGTD